MKQIFFLAGIILLIITCAQKEEPYFTHLCGWVKYPGSSDTLGINDIILQIIDINPDDVNRSRIRETTTKSVDSLPGFFEMDSVCYGTSGYQGSQTVVVRVDSTKNPGWPTQWQYLDLNGGIDTVVLYLTK